MLYADVYIVATLSPALRLRVVKICAILLMFSIWRFDVATKMLFERERARGAI